MDDTLDRLRNGGWRSLMVTRKDGRRDSCWVDKDGNWYNVPFGKHQIFALYVVQDLKQIPEDKAIFLDVHQMGDTLINEFGWLFIHADAVNGIIIHGLKGMSMKQYHTLRNHFKDTPIGKGWTIEKLWKANKAEDDAGQKR